MYDLTAQVTSSLLPFSGVTLEALGEDEITLDSVLHGKFTIDRSGLAWLACGPHLEVVNAVTGERLSAYCFGGGGGGGEHPPSVLAARDFSWLKRSGLLVGLEEAEGSVLCLYDLALSRVVKAVQIPGRIAAIEPLVSYGGASTLTQHLHQSLRWFFGTAAVVTDLGHVLLVDLCLDDLSYSQSELEASDLQIVTKSPAEIPRLREVKTREGRHLCLQLNAPTGVGATALQYISRTNQLAVGFSDGDLQLWNMKTLKKEYHSQLDGGRVPVYAFTFQEPENDPRNCCYVWAVQSSQDLEGDVVSLHLLQLAFSERKCLSSGKILYEGLEYCEERYSQDLSGTAFPLRAQATNTRLLSCLTIEKFRAHPDRDDSMNEVASPDTSVSVFSWQVRAYGQGTPTTYIGVFDINRWYHAQMPDSLRAGESLQNCPYLAVWSLDPVVQMVSPHIIMDLVVHERSLSRGLPFTCPPPEQYFNPTTYNFDATCLLNSGIVHLTCSGYQKETLSFLKKAAPCSSDIISTSYSHCLMSGLLSSRLADTQASSLSQEEQLDAILSTAVETSSLGLITGCIKQWTSEEQPGSALNLRYILDWAWNKVVQTKEELDGICAPLFDCSSNFTDSQTLQLLQHSQRLLGNLSAIFHCLLSEAQELTHKGLTGLMNKNMVSSLISKYAQVVLWFCRTGLLPEGSDDEALQIPRPFYTHSVISNYYTIRREELTRLAKGRWSADCLMIDGLVGQCGEHLTTLWKRDEGGTGQYPPPTLHALLDIYLLDNIDEAAKHAIVIYLLLDVMYSFPNKDGASVESFPTAFAIPLGLVKLVQGLWLLDHHDHQSSFELLLHPGASQYHFDWQHERVLQALMGQGQQSVALRYFRCTKPPISTTPQAKLCLSVLLNNRCLLEAWCLLRQHSDRLNMSELLGFMYESCQELGLMKELLKLPLGLNEQECLEKFLKGTGGLQNRELLMVHYLQQANYIPALQLNQSLKINFVNERDPKLKERSITRNSIMDQYGKVLPRVQRKLAIERAKPYQHPTTIHREVSRPQPLSTITKRSTKEKVISRAGFINNLLTKVEEVWLGRDGTPQSSPAKSPKAADAQTSSLALSEPFLGTPITMTSKRKSRLMDLVVHPSYQSPRPLLSAPRPPSSWISPKSTCKAPELSLLQTPQVVKRARALAAAGPVFSGFTPQSILRSSLRPTPVGTPSASPGRSITPPLSRKESRITFIEEAESPDTEKSMRWTNGVAADSEISLLSRSVTLSKATCKTWSSQPSEEEEDEEQEEKDGEEEQLHVKFLPPEGGIPSPQLRCSDSESSSIPEVCTKTKPSDETQTRLDTSRLSDQSADVTLEYFDAPLSEDLEEDGQKGAEDDDKVVTVQINPLVDTELAEPSKTTEQTSEETENQDEGIKEGELFEDKMEIVLEQEKIEEEPETERQVQQESNNEQENVESLEQEDESIQPEVVKQATENSDSGTEVESVIESRDLPVNAEATDVQDEATESVIESRDLPVNAEATDVQDEAPDVQDEAPDVQDEAPDVQDEAPDVQGEAPDVQDKAPVVQDEAPDVQDEAPDVQDEAPDVQDEAPDVQDESPDVQDESPDVQDEAPDVQDEAPDVQTEAPESPDLIEPFEPLEAEGITNTQGESQEQSTDLTEFVQRHLFGCDLSPPLTRSGIHGASQTQASFNSESVGDDKEVEPAAVDAPPVFTTQKSITSITSSEAAGTDSHSVVSLNDSEDLSSPASEEEEEEEDEEEEDVEEEESDQAEEEEEEEEEEEDSGSEVEIIEEVQGNGRLQPLQPSSVYVEQEPHAHFLPALSEDEAAAFSLIPPGEEIKMSEEEMEGEVVMVRLGTGDGEVDPDEDAEQGSSYVELKPSTTLLVPLELVEGHHNLVDGVQLDFPEIPPTIMQDDIHSDSHSSFSLMLDVDIDGEKEADAVVPVENNLPLSDPAALPQEMDASEESALPQVILLSSDDQDAPQSEEQEDEREEIKSLDGNNLEQPKEFEPQSDLQTDTNSESGNADEQEEEDEGLEVLTEAHTSPAPSVSAETLVEELPAAEDDKHPEEKSEVQEIVDETDLVVKTEASTDEIEEEDVPVPAENHEEHEENGPVTVETDNVPSIQMEPGLEEQLEVLTASEGEEKNCSCETETNAGITAVESPNKDENEKPEKQVLNLKFEPDEQSVPETTTSQIKPAPSTPALRMTRGRKTVSFISSLPVEEYEPEDEGDVEGQKVETSLLIPARPSRTPIRGKQVQEPKVQASTPRRSTRKTQPEPPKVEAEEAAPVEEVSSSQTSSPARRSQRFTATKTRTQSSSEELSASSDVEIKDDQEKEVMHVKIGRRKSSKTPTPAKSKTVTVFTPRRSSRRILSSSEEPPEILEEEKEQDEVVEPPAKRSTRKTKTGPSEVLPALVEEEEERKQKPASPGRTTRQSNRISLNLYPQSTKKMRGETMTENVREDEDLLNLERNKHASRSSSRRPTRKKLWDHPEEDLPLLDSPLEVDFETPVADALIQRLQAEEEKQDVNTKTIRSSRRRTKVTEEPNHSVNDSLFPEPEDNASRLGENTFSYSPSRRRTRSRRDESPGPSEEFSAPVTRSRRVKGVSPQDEITSEEDHVEVEKAASVSKTRNAGKRTANLRSRAAAEPVPIAEVDLISPLPSPADPLPKVQKRIKEEVPHSTRNLRRKRVMASVFTKPVTRRKKL